MYVCRYVHGYVICMHVNVHGYVTCMHVGMYMGMSYVCMYMVRSYVCVYVHGYVICMHVLR
jgi:hypothetical protein